MARVLRLPELAESVVEGEIVRWLVAEGEHVSLDQPVVEVMTDKVTVELPSPFEGVLVEQLVAEGDVVAVNAPIANFEPEAGSAAATPAAGEAGAADGAPNLQAAEERSIVETGHAPAEDDGDKLSLFTPSAGGDAPPFQVSRPATAAATTTSPLAAAQAVSTTRSAPASPAAGVVAPDGARGPYGRVLAVPAARKLARELAVDIEAVSGSGPNGRVRVDDVRAHHEAKSTDPAPYRPGPRPELEERIPVRGLRRVIAKQMMTSHLSTVRTLHVDEADVSTLVALREKLKPRAEARGVRLSYLPFIMKALVAALQAYPMLNASLDEEQNEIVRKHYYNIGMAVATDAGLLVPVVKAVDQRSILDIAADIQRLAELARDGKLAADDMQGGTFSVTNIGSLGGLFSFPIINIPEAAILGVHSIKKRPVVLPDDSIVARWMIYLSLSFDHRLVDGAEGASFTSHLIDLLENPEALLLDL